ncbi:AAA-like domain protein [compost metagenome]
MKRCGLISEEIQPDEPVFVPDLKAKNIKVGEWYYNTFIVTNWPNSCSSGWLDDLYNLDKNISLSMFVHPVDKNNAINYVSKKLVRLQSNTTIKNEKSRYQGEDDPEIATAMNMLEELNSNEGKFFFMSYYITVKSKTKTQLNKDSKYVQSVLNGMMIETKESILRQDDGFRCSLPHGVDYLKDKSMYTFTTTPLKRFFPFMSANIVDSGGILIGENLLNNALIFLNHFSYLTSSMIVLGKAGAGKSYTVKAQILKLTKQGVEVTVLDCEDEFGKLPQNNNLIVKKFKTLGEYKRFLVSYWENVKAIPNKPRFLVIDEFWEYMKDAEFDMLIQEIIKKCRKRWLGVCAISQEVEDLLKSEYARSLINNSSIKILLKMDSNQREVAQKTFGLTNSEVSFLVGAEEGEGILFAGTNHVQFKTIVSEEQHKLITTKPQELWAS